MRNSWRDNFPTAVEFVKELPRTPVGKLSRHELRKQQESSQAANGKNVA